MTHKLDGHLANNCKANDNQSLLDIPQRITLTKVPTNIQEIETIPSIPSSTNIEALKITKLKSHQNNRKNEHRYLIH